MAAFIAPGPTLIKVFGPEMAKGVGCYVQNFRFPKTDEHQTMTTLHLDLAPSLGTLTKDSMIMMDDKLKVLIAGMMRELAKLKLVTNLSWEQVVSVCMQDPLMEPFDEPISKKDNFTKEGKHAFKFDGSPDPAIVQEVSAWFKKLINDDDVLKSTTINDENIEFMGRIVAQTGATIDDFLSFFHKDERHEQTMVDIGVLRFPEIQRPFFQVYRIKLVAFSSSERTLAWQSDHNGITGEYNSRKFKPREYIIKDLLPEVKAKAMKEANDVFAD
ncbi:hypothetical protein FA95DRAFT_969147 [Auriscalpium vulgare]|uniref:Uncharacterized protein n=1 Tax=Auriscalpium vulgare TaxID=40419 RepID=A0ACB8R8J5_9AGAM|nr:hypothetical protein FA95DRAFT_969147 [Auriscalpium vulgare]